MRFPNRHHERASRLGEVGELLLPLTRALDWGRVVKGGDPVSHCHQSRAVAATLVSVEAWA